MSEISSMKQIIKKVFGSRNERLIKKLSKTVAKSNSLEAEIAQLSDEELSAKTIEFKASENLDALLPEVFAVVREASVRILEMRPYDVQLIGAMVLDSGKIAEMKTGEGKTLMSTMAVYLNALKGNGVHVVTVNDYLAERDANWMGRIYKFLGLSVGVVTGSTSPSERKAAYACDITYGTNNEFGFDYLRDNMAFSKEDRVQRGHAFAIVDEVDSILIDEARTPLIISGPSEDHSDLYQVMSKIAPTLERQAAPDPEKPVAKIGDEELPGDFSVDEKRQQILLTESGYEKLEKILIEKNILQVGDSLYDSKNISIMHLVYGALRAHVIYQKNVHYIVNNNKVVIVDEFTGRTMEGRRWSDGLHQAVEAKEGVPIQNENQTVASITFQNYFRLYKKLSGMTGTADTEAYELQQTYGLEVVVIPTHEKMIREDHADQIFLSTGEKYKAIIDDVKSCQERGQPVLVGTASIEVSEVLSQLLSSEKIKHEVLNAKQHEREANIIENAGVANAVTIATNMAGRGTDISLGGNLDALIAKLGNEPDKDAIANVKQQWQQAHDQVIKSGGLHIIGSERHESRRIDNQLRGRSGRQGDPGSSRFYLSLEDSLMRIFASGKLGGMMQKLGMEEGESIEHKWVSKAIENAQRKVEGHNFDIRKNLLEYDDVANDQRKVVYEQRNQLMDVDDISDRIIAIREDVVNELIDEYIPRESLEEQWDIPGLEQAITEKFAHDFPIAKWLEEDHDLHEETLRDKIIAKMIELYEAKTLIVGDEMVRHFEKAAMLQILDHHWKEHLQMMDHLRQGIHLRGYAQKNPKQEYKRESFELFRNMLESVKKGTLEMVTKVQAPTQEEMESERQRQAQQSKMEYQHAEVDALDLANHQSQQPKEAPAQERPYVREQKKIGRNEPCPCGSGKKYKRCHGRLG